MLYRTVLSQQSDNNKFLNLSKNVELFEIQLYLNLWRIIRVLLTLHTEIKKFNIASWIILSIELSRGIKYCYCF